ncbi:MAG: TolC family protein [Bacteroides sp.]|nr:TolC family protein [Roseburia sp.]MCM1347681.1 TolC family protein [Bacteroides sp.]MCM1422114.1 TolC family protein [Bacteroides sp.]
MNRIVISVIALCVHIGMEAQSMDVVLESVEKNNIELQAVRKGNEAAVWEMKAGNNLEGLSVEYSPFYRKGVSGMASSELVVTQGFDFPTLYAARKKAGDLQQTVFDWQYQTVRRDILLEAKNLCIDLIFLEKERALLEMRGKNADSLLMLYEKKMAEGDATIIEINKIKMERMGVLADRAKNKAAHNVSMQALVALNGNEPLSFSESCYPDFVMENDWESMKERILSADPALRMLQAETEVSLQEVKVSKHTGIPKLEVGYRRNTEMREASNGFLVGASIPIFSNRHKVKAAKAQFVTAQMRRDNEYLQAENKVRAQYEEIKMLKSAVEVYDTHLMYATLEVLRTAVEEGGLSLADYYIEADAIYKGLQEHLRLENQYMKAVAEFYKNDL